MSSFHWKYKAAIFVTLTVLGVIQGCADAPHVRDKTLSYRTNKPPVICKIPAIKVALKGKCRRRTDSNTKERPHKKSSTTKSSASSAK